MDFNNLYIRFKISYFMSPSRSLIYNVDITPIVFYEISEITL